MKVCLSTALESRLQGESSVISPSVYTHTEEETLALKLQLPEDLPQRKGKKKKVKIITNYLSALKPPKQNCFTLPGFRNQRISDRNCFTGWCVCFVVVLLKEACRGFSHIRNAEQLGSDKRIIYTVALKGKLSSFVSGPHGHRA